MNVVSHGPTDTAMFSGASDELREEITRQIPLGRIGMADEVAAAAFFLASDESSFVAGAELCVDGGMAQVQKYPSPHHTTPVKEPEDGQT